MGFTADRNSEGMLADQQRPKCVGPFGNLVSEIILQLHDRPLFGKA
jgi:hypothetical protein